MKKSRNSFSNFFSDNFVDSNSSWRISNPEGNFLMRRDISQPLQKGYQGKEFPPLSSEVRNIQTHIVGGKTGWTRNLIGSNGKVHTSSGLSCITKEHAPDDNSIVIDPRSSSNLMIRR
jgi:hypothetical protein